MIGALPLPWPARTRTAAAGAGSPGGSPEAQPRYARPALLAILAMAAVLFGWDIQHSGYHLFYSETAHSMSMSWKGFLYGAYDPGNSITIDKLPGFLWPQALCARIFGFHGWALTLPQAVEGVLSVWVMHRAVRRWAGTDAALLASAAFTLTPVIAGLFRTEVEDPSFTLFVLLAGDATLRAARGARLRPLLAAAAWVGLGFQAKMLEAWAVIPALGLLYGVSAPAALRRRFAHLAAAGALCVAVSVSWVVLVTLTPAHDRPYIDGTTDNSAVSQVVGYNFLNRFSALGVSAKDTGSVSGATMVGSVPSAHSHGGQSPRQWAKMFGKSLASQVGWLYPAAALSAAAGLVRRRGRPRTDPLRAGFLLWTVWLATYFLVFSAGSVGTHIYYMGVVAAPMAALFGAGTVQLWRSWRAGGRVGTWGLPAMAAATVAWAALIAGRFPAFLPWLTPAVCTLGAAALALLAASRRAGAAGRAGRTTAALGLAVAIVAMLLAPAAWASSVLNPRYGHSGMGAAGPLTVHRAAGAGGGAASHARDGRVGGPGAVGTVRLPGHPRSAARTPGPLSFRAYLDPEQRRLLAYTTAHQDGAPYLFATLNWRLASPYLLYSDAKVLPAGGFTGEAASPTRSAFLHLIATGRLRYVVLDDPVSRPGTWIKPWVRAHCTRTAYRPNRLYLCEPSSTS